MLSGELPIGNVFAHAPACRPAVRGAGSSGPVRPRSRSELERLEAAELQDRQSEVVQERHLLAEGDRLDHFHLIAGEAEQLSEVGGGDVQRLAPGLEGRRIVKVGRGGEGKRGGVGQRNICRRAQRKPSDCLRVNGSRQTTRRNGVRTTITMSTHEVECNILS
jgi:hypothetical protein